MADDKNLGWALKNGDLDRVKEQIEADVSLKITQKTRNFLWFFGKKFVKLKWLKCGLDYIIRM